MNSKNIFWSTTIKLGGHDLPIAVLSIVVWAGLLGVADWRVMLVLTTVRALAWVLYARRLLAPAATWRRLADGADAASLRAADLSLHRFSRRFTSLYVGGWLSLLLSSMLLSYLGVPKQASAGTAEWLIGGVLIATIAVAEVVTTRPLISNALMDIQHEVASALSAQGLRTEAPPSSIASSVTVVVVGLTVILATLFASLGGMIRTIGIRTHTLETQRRLAELGALHLQHGAAERLDPSVRVVDSSGLPAVLAHDASASGETLTVVDARNDRVLAAAPVGDERWVLAEASPDEQLDWLLLFLIGFGSAIMGLGALVGRDIAGYVSGPLAQLDETTRHVAETGEVRGLERVVTHRNDEVGQLAANFNRMIDVLELLASAAAAVAAGDLRVQLDHPGDLYDAFRGMLERLRGVIADIRHVSHELAATAAEVHAASVEQEVSAEHQSAKMREVIDTVASLARSAIEITKSAAAVLENAEQTATTTDEMAVQITELSAQTGSIGGLLEVIREIAERSDILALNGSLEATRAGEAGRGFALVAAEMRRLAERVDETVADVRTRVGDIERSGASTVAATVESRELAQDTAVAARVISAVTRRQGDDTQSASEAIEEVAQSMLAAAAATSQTRAAAEGLRLQADELERLIGQFQTASSPARASDPSTTA
ncbi:methyl-accepting chemotaxis protein [Enhygromyxa salina]|uniref:methyl-accepting chemotaxis protein n=1 Tax=Enhygromyxa salina TaxID=215803 RepID=UPI000D094F74|nr:HAMP domain-containing methyl-accepting chemotaxis protein [Enhygromyxa salina]